MRRTPTALCVSASWLLLPCLLLACAAGRIQVSDGPAPVVWSERGSSVDGSATGSGEDVARPFGQRLLLASAPVGPGTSGPSHVRRWKQLTAARLIHLAREKGIGVSGSVVERNRQIGRAFQEVVMRSIEVIENTRPFPTSVRRHHDSVIPDGVLPAGRLNLMGRMSLDPEGAFLEIIHDGDSLDMLEVKARATRITLSTGQGQIRGFIEVLGRRRQGGSSMVAESRPRPALLLITTAEASISEDVTWEAARHGVAVYRAIPEEFEGRIDVGPFMQQTKFADVPEQFQLRSVPEELK